MIRKNEELIDKKNIVNEISFIAFLERYTIIENFPLLVAAALFRIVLKLEKCIATAIIYVTS